MLQELRNKLIMDIENSQNKTKQIIDTAENLYTLGLTMYSRNYSLDSIFYNSFAQSSLDENISLHPEQLNILNKIQENQGVVFSAPTSFGKTFVLFEYIARENPQNVVLIVPTLALVDEYNKKIIKKYQSVFNKYNVYLSINDDYKYNFDDFNLFILTHDRAIENANYSTIDKIDFLVIDEVYKLKKNDLDDRVLILNLAYLHLVRKSKKHLLLAPFIGGIQNIDVLEKSPIFVKSNFSPVVNTVKTYEIINEGDRFSKVIDILNSFPDNPKTMIYFPTVSQIYSFVKNQISNFKAPVLDSSVIAFINWLKDEIHEEWYLVKAMEKGFLVHNGQLPMGIRIFQLDLYDNIHSNFNKLLCTSTLLEGVNTAAKHIIISKPSRTGNNKSPNFDAFDFYNLVGRSGRLFEHFLGVAHYIKSPNDPRFIKNDAIKNIEFEITGNSEDINIHTGNIDNEKDYLEFLRNLGISHEEYINNIGAKFRFRTILRLFNNYQINKRELFNELTALFDNTQRGRFNLVTILYKIFEGKNNNLDSSIINQLLHKHRFSIKKIINDTFKYFNNVPIDHIITTTLRLKSSYIEYDFFSKLIIIMYFMECDSFEEKLINILDNKVKQNIDFLYFTDSKSKKMLKDLGIYERDINIIIKIIGENFNDTFELKNLLLQNKDRFKKLSYLSNYIIESLI